ncbi:MAG: DUF5320 domain-containing protein [Candidatus Hecatellaceae archaeon]
MSYGYGWRYRRIGWMPGLPGWAMTPSWFAPSLPPVPQSFTAEQERQMLEQQAQMLESQIDAIKKRLEELKSQPQGQPSQQPQPPQLPPFPMFPAFPPYMAPPPTPEEEIADLEDYKRELEEEIKSVENRIAELKRMLGRKGQG